MFEFIDVEKKFQEDFWKKPKIALDKLSFRVVPGSLCGFLGANGAGKTTTVKAFFKFIQCDQGQIKYSEELGKKWSDIKNSVGYFPERPYFYPQMTGREFCRYIFSLGSHTDFESRLLKWSKKINIDYALDQKLNSYSKGMLQRIGFVTAVLANPKIVILDEPLSGLDPIGRKEFKDAFKELHSEGVTIFFSSHIVSDVEEICDHLVVIKKGKTTFCGEKSTLIEPHQDHNIYEVFFRSENDFSNEKEILHTGNDTYRLKVHQNDLDRSIQNLYSKNINIEKVYPLRPSLENIVYEESR